MGLHAYSRPESQQRAYGVGLMKHTTILCAVLISFVIVGQSAMRNVSSAAEDDEMFWSRLGAYKDLYYAARLTSDGEDEQLQRKWRKAHNRLRPELGLTEPGEPAREERSEADRVLALQVGTWLSEFIVFHLEVLPRIDDERKAAGGKPGSAWWLAWRDLERVTQDAQELSVLRFDPMQSAGIVWYRMNHRDMYDRHQREGDKQVVRDHDRAWMKAELEFVERQITEARLEQLASAKDTPWHAHVATAVERFRLARQETSSESSKAPLTDSELWDRVESARLVLLLGEAFRWGPGVPPVR